jgi:hypothetical protein
MAAVIAERHPFDPPILQVQSPSARYRRSRWPLVLMAAALLVACSPGRGMESVLVLQDIEAGRGPSTLKETTPEPTRAAISFEIDGREREADLYAPGAAARAGMVLVPGVTPEGRGDPQVVAFAETLARARFEVIVPDLPAMRSLQVTALDAVPIAAAARFLDERGRRPLGMAAVSFAVGPAIIALDQPQAAGRVDFFVAIGGYYDLEALITYITTGFFREQESGPWLYRPPKAYGKWVFVLTNSGRIADPDDRATLFEMASRRLDDAGADVSDLVVRLGPQGRSVYALISNGDPDRVSELIADLPPEVRGEIERLDLRQHNLAALDTDFLLIHDRDDRIIPASQSAALTRAVAPGRAQLYLVGGLDHAQVKTLGIGDALTLLQAVYECLRLRDEPSG